MEELEQPDEHSMDIPRVVAIDLPLNVKNVDKAIGMLGGETSIRASLRDNQPLELRLRKDPFHHPIQALSANNERILLKIRIPKKSLPENSSSLPIRELLKINSENNATPDAKIQPVGIIDKTYLFKAISDFQVSTKNNQFVQKFNKVMLNYEKFDDIKNYVDEHNAFDNFVDLNDEYFKNTDHHLIPPPILSPIRFPFDYKYQKNPSTSTVKDDHGELKVVAKKDRQKLHTLMIDYNSPAPKEAVEAIKINWEKLNTGNLDPESSDYLLLKCINYLKELFKAKPIWNRKQLLDIVEEDLKRFIKHALPYVSFIYRSGPWRFCNIKYGVDVVHDSQYWPYQTEYFRVPGLRDVVVTEGGNSKKVVAPTLKNYETKIEVSENLLFNGSTLPSVTTFQIGDVLDPDITEIIKEHQFRLGKEFLRDTCDFQDGWVNRQTMEVIRRIMRYKLGQLVKDDIIEQSRIQKIIYTDYTTIKEDEDDGGKDEDDDNNSNNDNNNNNNNGRDVEEEEEEDDELEDVTQMDIDIDLDNDNDNDDNGDANGNGNVNEKEIISKLGELGTDASDRMSKLVGFIKQDSIENQSVEDI